MLVFDGKVAQIYLNKLQCDSWCIYAGGGNFTVDDVLICVKRLQSVIMLNQPENVSEPDSGHFGQTYYQKTMVYFEGT